MNKNTVIHDKMNFIHVIFEAVILIKFVSKKVIIFKEYSYFVLKYFTFFDKNFS